MIFGGIAKNLNRAPKQRVRAGCRLIAKPSRSDAAFDRLLQIFW